MLLAASGIILQNKKILLLQRSNYTQMYAGCWGCPGGRAEANETAEENVIREVKEECNLDFTPKKIIKIGTWQEKKFYRFLGDWSGEIKIQETEVTDYNWFTFKQTQQLQLAFDYKEIVEILHNQSLL
ncbi:NUDIX domain-containing protein [Lutibacter sp. HS1-25]|uniref:NUDIX hydrolase n=1 Tax=Lutibacter sp. HS1-25 TaxID=2485000 RepID=UPI0010129BA9|nr:NUDIX domain-containing protein [Lutibacter sp. HS1-25]RXP46585.1 NUDIX domain-containing protein [Lutibacter sp. HS1-25]